MRNLLCISFYGAAWGGSFIPSLLALEEEAKNNGVGITFLFPKMGEALPWANLFPNAYWIENDFFLRKGCSVKLIVRLLQIMHRHHITDVVTNFLGYNANLRIVRLLYGGGYSQIFHNTFHTPSRISWKRKLKLLILEGTYDQFIGVSGWVAQSLVSGGLPPSRITKVNNAIDFKRLNSWTEMEMRKEEREILIFMMGWPYYVKGVDIAIRAIHRLRMEGMDAVLVTPHKNVFSDIVRDFQEVPSFVRFVEAREDVATFYNNVDVFLSASREEGFGYANAEAVMARCVVLNSDIPPTIDMEIPYNIFFKTGDVDDLYAKLKYCIENKQLILSYKSKQQQYVKDTFSMELWSRKMLDTILQVNKKLCES